MIDITGLREDKRPQSSTIVHALLDRLEAAEKERDAAELMSLALRAKIEAMEKQEPIGWFARVDGDGPLMECKHSDISRVPLYTLPGAQPAPSVPECPYPCGWKNLLKHVIEDGAYFPRHCRGRAGNGKRESRDYANGAAIARRADRYQQCSRPGG